MKIVPQVSFTRRTLQIFFSLLLTLSFASQNHLLLRAQPAVSKTTTANEPVAAKPAFRLERMQVAGGAELLTIFGSLDGLPLDDRQAKEAPLVCLLRDTLGDDDPQNDRLRYLWMLTYTRPTFWQHMASAVPFLYTRVGSKENASKSAPPPIMDLKSPGGGAWKKIFWMALQSFVLDTYGLPVKATTRTYRRNTGDYRKAHVVRALAILSLYEKAAGGTQIFTTSEMHDIQARLMLTDKTLGSLVDEIQLPHVYEKQTTLAEDVRGHNWELLRQHAEAQMLYFEPLQLPDGSASHAMLWVARPDLAKFRDRKFNSRFLNIANPWRDDRLRFWDGYVETRYFDAENRPVAKDTPGARAVQMIPLALYGLDHPKIPILLVDFRSKYNAKGRETTRRALEDVARNVLSLSKFGDIPYFLGRQVYDFVTGRRGMDIHQPSRLRAYSQLKLLLSLSASLDPDLRDEISERVERVSLNPLENDMEAEARLARQQYAALVEYARRADGLPAQLDRDRRAEMVPFKHGKTGQILFRLGNLLTFGLYTHREKATPELQAQMELARRLDYHERYLREVARSSPVIEVVQDMDEVRASLRFIAEHGAVASGKTAKAVARIFAQTEDEETRKLSLSGLYRINNEAAKKELLALYSDEQVTSIWRLLIAEHLRNAVRAEQRIAPKDAKIISSVVGL
ncbi:MAG: hypothetical protein H7Y30_15045 [Pyrinomonadaceae bacterium]|nr:hypothetical protein [Pyrinomonadaceae bacterium]